MKMIATKNISKSPHGSAIILSIESGDEKWMATYEEDNKQNIILDSPIKVLHKKGDHKSVLSSFREFNITDELVKALDRTIRLWEDAPEEHKRVLM